MNVIDAIKNRYSVRSYQDKPVEEEKLHQILEAARLSPSAANHQERKFVVVTDPTVKSQLRKAAKDQKFVEEAPIVIAGCATESEYVMPCGQPGYPVDITIAMDHITLLAVELGLGTCWIGAFFEDQVKEVLNIPKDIRVVILMTLGYPADQPRPKSRKSIKEITCFNLWQ